MFSWPIIDQARNNSSLAVFLNFGEVTRVTLPHMNAFIYPVD